MPNVNDFLAFGISPGSNVLSQAAYASIPARGTGHVAGVAPSDLCNKSWRQASVIAATIGSFIVSQGYDALDDGDLATLLTNFQAALKKQTDQRISDLSAINIYISSTGSDANDGLTISTPIQTFTEALTRGNKYRSLSIFMLSDITVPVKLPVMFPTNVYIQAPQSSPNRTLTFASGAWGVDPDGIGSCMRHFGNSLYFNKVDIVNNITNAAVWGVVVLGGGQVTFGNANYSVLSSSVRPLFATAQVAHTLLAGLTYNTTARDKILEFVTGATNPNSIFNWQCNLTAL